MLPSSGQKWLLHKVVLRREAFSPLTVCLHPALRHGVRDVFVQRHPVTCSSSSSSGEQRLKQQVVCTVLCLVGFVISIISHRSRMLEVLLLTHTRSCDFALSMEKMMALVSCDRFRRTWDQRWKSGEHFHLLDLFLITVFPSVSLWLVGLKPTRTRFINLWMFVVGTQQIKC